MKYFQVTSEDITRLDDFELTKLLSILLYNEASKFSLIKNSVSVSLNITVGDDGEDGHIKWNDNIECTDWIPKRYTLFQVKATDMPPSTCKQEVLRADGILKPRVEDVVNQQGCYILFHNRKLNEKLILNRVQAFKESIKSVKNDADIKIEIYDAGKIAAWCNQYISAIYAVWEWNGKAILLGANTWDSWNGHFEYRNKFISDYEIQQKIEELRNYLSDERKVARILGLPGKGKTRLALEVFRSDGSIEGDSLSKGVVYVDANYSKERILSSITSWRNLGVSGVIVVDNCDYELHKRLKSAVEHIDSKFSLLTIDYNLHQTSSSDPLISLDSISNEIIEGILKNSFPEMDQGDLKRIVNFADGFPSIATLLAEASVNDFETIGSLQDETLVNKLLWGRDNVDSVALKVIEACAIFDHIGFSKEKEYEMKYVAEKICGINEDEFYEKCNYFMKKKIMVEYGRYIKLVPKTLAITLASRWWEKCRPQKAQEILADSNLPSSMVEQLCNQISKLHFLEKAKELTATLCGIQAPFGQAEILSSELGSRIFCSFVEIDPIITVNTLAREFEHLSQDELLAIKDGRRNLVRALEKLCFWEDTFTPAAKILAKFAAAENEHWSNNATGQFNQLFHYILSGTQANFEKRIAVLKWAILSGKSELKKIGLLASSHALQAEGFSRMVGVEVQGSRRSMEEWTPNNWGEVFDYWSQTIDLLIEVLEKEDTDSNLIFDIISDNIVGLCRRGYIDNIDSKLNFFFEKKEFYWPEFLEQIKRILKYDESKIPDKIVKIIRGWQDKLKPRDIKTKLLLLVSAANDDYIEVEGSENKYENNACLMIDKLLDEIYPVQKDEIISNIKNLLLGEQKQSFYFCKQLFNKIVTEDKKDFLRAVSKEIIDIAQSADKQSLNLNFVGGMLSTLQSKEPELFSEFLSEFRKQEYAILFVEMIRFIEVNDEILTTILKFVKESNIKVDKLLILSYGSALNTIEEDSLISFVREIYNINFDYNQIVAWKILYRYYLNYRDLSISLSNTIIDFLSDSTILLLDENISFEVTHILEKLYQTNFVDKDELSRNIMNHYLETLKKDKNYRIERLIGENIELLTKYTPILSWDLLSENLLTAEGLYKYRLNNILGNKFFKKNNSAIQNVPIGVLKNWATTNNEAPEILANIYPINAENENEFIDYIINTYGENEKVLRNIDRQLTTFSWSGSLIPYYERLKDFYRKYLDSQHPVNQWASKKIYYLDIEIQNEKLRDEEEKLGFD